LASDGDPTHELSKKIALPSTKTSIMRRHLLLLAATLLLAPTVALRAPVRPSLHRVASPVRSTALASAPPRRAVATSRVAPVRMQQYRLGPGGGPGFNFDGLLGPAIFLGLFFSGALGWLFNFFIGLQLLIIVIPVVAVPLFQWWISSNLLEGTCPTCSCEMQVFKGQTTQCNECGTVCTSELSPIGVFLRQPSQTGPGVIEIDVLTDDD